jgi:hypothetical protein
MDMPQIFWDAFREPLRAGFAGYQGGGSVEWTRIRLDAAKSACHEFVRQLGKEADVDADRYQRIDVHAIEKGSGRLLVAFESELARPPNKGDWRNEFRKLCNISADLRVLSSVFEKGGGSQGHLEKLLSPMRTNFIEGASGPFLLAFGPESARDDPEQWWTAYSLEPNFVLRPLVSNPLFIPYRTIPRR